MRPKSGSRGLNRQTMVRRPAPEARPKIVRQFDWRVSRSKKERRPVRTPETLADLSELHHSNDSGCKLKSSPAAFFSAYFFIQASQLLPAAVSRPENASAAISAYETVIFSEEFFG